MADAIRAFAAVEETPDVSRDAQQAAAAILEKELRQPHPNRIRELLPLLSSSSPVEVQIAKEQLSQSASLNAEEIALLEAALPSGHPIVAMLLIERGAPNAIRAVVDALATTPYSPFAYEEPLRRQSVDVLSATATYVSERRPFTDSFAAFILYFSYWMGAQQAPVAAHYASIAGDATLPRDARRFAVEVLGAMGAASTECVPTLRAVAQTTPELADTCALAIDDIVTRVGRNPKAESLSSTAQRLRTGIAPPVFYYRLIDDLAGASTAKPAVRRLLLPYLDDPRPEVRAAAVRALARVGTSEDHARLRHALHDPTSDRVVAAAITAVTAVRDHKAIADLQALANTHWYPAIRDAARSAREHLESAASEETTPGSPAIDFTKGTTVRSSTEDVSALNLSPEPNALSRAALATHAYEVDYPEDWFGGSAGKSPSPMRTLKRSPTAGIEIEGGVLLASDKGEWGGEVYFEARRGNSRVIVPENTVGLHTLGDGIVAVTRSSAPPYESQLYRITVDENGEPRSSLWHDLPSTIQRSGRLATGELYLATTGFDVVVSQNGTLRLATPQEIAAVRGPSSSPRLTSSAP